MKIIKTLLYFPLLTFLLGMNSQAFAARYYFGQQYSNNVSVTGFFEGEDTRDGAGNANPNGMISTGDGMYPGEISNYQIQLRGHPLFDLLQPVFCCMNLYTANNSMESFYFYAPSSQIFQEVGFFTGERGDN